MKEAPFLGPLILLVGGGLESKSVAKRSFWRDDPNLPQKICAQGKSYALRFCTPAARLAGTLIKERERDAIS